MKNGPDYITKKFNAESLEKQIDSNIDKAVDELLKGEWLKMNNDKILQKSIKNNTETIVDNENIEKLIVAEVKRLIRKDHNIDLGTVESDELDKEYPNEVIIENLKNRVGNLVDLFQMPENYIDKGY